MRILALISSLLAVSLGLPFKPKDILVPVNVADQRPLVVGDLLPVQGQGHVVVENPAPQPRPDSSQNEAVNEPPIMVVDNNEKVENSVLKAEQNPAPGDKVNVGLNGDEMGEVEAYLEPNDEMVHTEEFQDNTQLGHVEEGEAIQDLERKYEMFEQPIMKLEPLSNEEMQTDELLGTLHMNSGVYEEPIMFLEPEIVGSPLLNEEILPNAEMEDEGPMLDALGQPMQHLEEYYPNNEVVVRLDPETVMEEESERVRKSLIDEPLMSGEENKKVRERRSCPGVVLGWKCFQFFQSPKTAADAEFYCQENFPDGHLASITSPVNHNEIMNLMRQNGGTRRTWVGGLRFLDTGRFIWLDGSKWSYADWLLGEPNNTSNVENCLEVLASGKFNDFTCWEPQAFI